MRSTSNLNNYFKLFSTDIQSILKEFSKSPQSNIFFKNKKGLIESSNTVDFNNQQWNHNPMLFCLEYYAKQYYYPVVLLCNNIGTIYQFNQSELNNKIIAPKTNIIISILSFEKQN